MKQLNLTTIRNRVFDIAHIIILGNVIGYWVGYKTAIIQYADMGVGAFLFFLVASVPMGFVPAWFFEYGQFKFKIGSFSRNDVLRTMSGVTLGLLTSLYYRDIDLFHFYNWTFLITAIAYCIYCAVLVTKREK